MNIVKKYVGKGKRKTTIGMEREQTTSEYEKAIQYIDQLIQQGDLRIGSKLPTERAIAEELGIGRNSTREALSILHGMGMIERVQGSGNYISKDAGGSIHRILRMMLALGTITGKEIADFRCMMEKAVCLDLLERGLREEQQTYFEKLLQGMEAASTEEFLEPIKRFMSSSFVQLGILCLFCFWNRYRSCIRSRSHASCNRPMRTGEENF